MSGPPLSRRLVSLGAVRGLPVVGRADGVYVGKLDDVLISVEGLVAIGYTVRAPGFWGGRRGIEVAAMERLGRDFVIVRDADAAEPAGDARGKLDDRLWISEWLGARCITRRGAEVGKLVDVLLEGDGTALRVLVLDGGRVLVPGRRCEVGRDSVVVEELDVPLKPADAADTAGWWREVEALLPAV